MINPVLITASMRPLSRWTLDPSCSRITTTGVTENLHRRWSCSARFFLLNRTHVHTMNPSPELFSWIANQSAFIEVMVGVFFCLVIAPAVLAGAATVITLLEGYVETGLSAIPMLNNAPALASTSATSRGDSGVLKY